MAIYSIEALQVDCYPDTTVLINKLGLRKQNQLDKAEKKIVTGMIVKIKQDWKFEHVDFDYYRAIHRALFSDLYDWAGEVRTINLSKKGTIFCPASEIAELGRLKFERLSEMQYFRNLDFDEFVAEIADLYHELNMLHPFREGNGRTLRLFITLLVRNAGYSLNFAECDKDFLMIATIRASQGDISLLCEVFSQLLK